ncbi:MAG: glycerol-3-phosphate acyltransferase [Candidatus Dormibacteraeota bacterium]|nr:glycerol-3-phosphate acyltransferase [Candidatus Dormibacteraeota bacterium]
MTATVLLAVAGYLVGAVPTGLVFGKFAGVDPRLVGSGRVGATNTYRALGLPASIAVAVIDALKGALMAYLGLRYAAGEWGLAAVVLATVLGQVYSVFLLAQGGRGVATTAGASLVLWPLALLPVVAIGLVTGWRTRIVSTGSLVAAIALPVFVYLLTLDIPRSGLALALGALLWVSHRDNLARLRAGSEPPLGSGSASGGQSDPERGLGS